MRGSFHLPEVSAVITSTGVPDLPIQASQEDQRVADVIGFIYRPP